MGNGPLITRSELRRRREEQEGRAQQDQTVEPHIPHTMQAPPAAKQKQPNFYRKEIKKNKPLKKTRTGEKQKSRDWDRFLVKAIIVVALLIVIVMLATFML